MPGVGPMLSDLLALVLLVVLWAAVAVVFLGILVYTIAGLLRGLELAVLNPIAALFGTGQTADDPAPIRLDENEFLGVVAYGLRHSVHGTSEGPSTVDPTEIPTAGTLSRFRGDTQTLTFETSAGGRVSTSQVVVEVVDPTAVWEAAPDPEEPVRSLVAATGDDLAAADETLGALTTEELHRELSRDGIAVDTVERSVQLERSFEIETAPEQWHELRVTINPKRVDGESATAEDVVLPALRDALAEIDDEQLDAAVLTKQLDDAAITVEATAPCEPPTRQTLQREAA